MDLTDCPMLDKQIALLAMKANVVAARPALAAVPAVDNDTLLDVNEDDDWELKGAVGLDTVDRAGLKRKMQELQEECRAMKGEAPTSVAEAFTLTNEQLGIVDARMSKVKRAPLLGLE